MAIKGKAARKPRVAKAASKSAEKTNGSGASISQDELQQRIQDRAYFLSLEAERAGCSSQENWSQAEADVKSQLRL